MSQDQGGQQRRRKRSRPAPTANFWRDSPTPVEPTYGFMNFYVNKDRTFMPSAPASAFAHQGNGTNLVYADPQNDLVAVLRWIDRPQIDGFVQRLLEAVRGR